MKVGDILEGEILSLSSTGDGVLKTDGNVVFVELGVPRQTVQIEIIKKKKKVFFAKVLEVLKKSPHEVAPFDPEFPQHGGAPWQHIAYSEQLVWKESFVKDSLVRIGKQENPCVDDIVESPTTERYRNKMEFSFGFERMRTETDEEGNKTHFDENPGLGLHRRGNWREIVRITDTLLCSTEMLTVKNILADFAAASGLPVWNPIRKQGFWRHVTVRESQRTKEMLVHVQVAERKSTAFWKEVLENVQKSLEEKNIRLAGFSVSVFAGVSVAPPNFPATTLTGEKYFHEEFCGLTFAISHDAFFQVNTPSAEKLTETIAEYANLNGNEHVLDLFCGAGTLGLSVAKHCASVTGVELITSAVKDAIKNAKANGVKNARFLAGMVEDVLPELLEQKKFDAVIVDPPRAGLSKKARKTIAELPVERLVLVSCNPVTLSRDVMDLEPFGWKLEKARPHDLFPHTPHVETVAVLKKKKMA